jgi:hypothetical protein
LTAIIGVRTDLGINRSLEHALEVAQLPHGFA